MNEFMICISLPGIKSVVFKFNSNNDVVYMQANRPYQTWSRVATQNLVANCEKYHAAVEHELLSLLQHHGIGTIVTERTSSCNETFAAPTSRTHHCRGLTSVDLYRHPHQHTSATTLSMKMNTCLMTASTASGR